MRIAFKCNWVTEDGEELNTFPIVCVPSNKKRFGESIVKDDSSSEFPVTLIIFDPITSQLNIVIPLEDRKSIVFCEIVIVFDDE